MRLSILMERLQCGNFFMSQKILSCDTKKDFMFAVSVKGLYNVVCRSELCEPETGSEALESGEEKVCRSDLCRLDIELKVLEAGREGIKRIWKGVIL